MTVTVTISDAKTRLSELIAKVEAGEEVIIARGREPVAKLGPLDEVAARRTVIEKSIAFRKSGVMKPVTAEELVAWKHEGRKY